MANEPSKTPTPQPQAIPLSKIHDLPGAVISKQPDKSYGGLVTSIQAGGVKEPVVLRLREDGEYQLVTGYRRRRACELAKLKDTPAPGQGQQKPNQGKDAVQTAAPAAADKAKDEDKPAQEPKPAADQGQQKPTEGKDAAQAAADKTKDGAKPAQEPKPAADQGQQKPTEGKDPAQTAAPAAADKAKDGDKPAQEPKPAANQGQQKPTEEKDAAQTAAPAASDKAKDGAKPAQEPKPAADQGQQKPTEGKDAAQAAAPAAADKTKDGAKPAQEPKPAADQGQQKPAEGKDTAQAAAPTDKAKDGDKPAADQDQQKPTEGKDAERAAAPAAADKAKDGAKPAQEPKPADQGQQKPAQAPAVTGPAARGPVGTAITQTLPERLSPPDEAAKKDFSAPKEGESIFVTLHPAYLVKSEYNTISVDTKSEDYQELKKSIELNGVKDPVLARIGNEGTLEIISGQRRHMIATELNYPVPTIIQKISDADAKILVADGNLHRPKISTYDLSRSLRMKMEGMKQKAGRRKKGYKAEELYSDTKLAQEMGIPGYSIDEATRTQTVVVNPNDTQTLTFYNTPSTTLVIEKYIEGTTTPIKGVTFLVTDSSGAVIGNSNGEYMTGEAGRIVLEGLEPGSTITAKEVKTVEGAVLDTTPKSIKIKAGEVQYLRFYNKMQGTIVVRKLDKQTGEPLAGVEFQITYSDGSYLDDDYGHLSSKGLYKTGPTGEIRITGVVGTLVISEVTPLPGYVMDEGTRTQTVKVNPGDTQTITVYNTKIGGLTIIKKDEETGERIKGVQFEIRRLNGEIIGTFTTDSNGVIQLPQAEKGWFEIVERKAGEGYTLDDTPHRVEVKDGQTAILEITNRKAGSAIIHKVDSLTGEGIYGVKFLISDAKGNPLGVYESDNEGYVFIDKELADGKYTARELECADGYILDTQPKTFYVQYGGCSTITWPNTAVRGQIQIIKKSADYNSANGLPAGTPLAGATFEIYNERNGNKVDTIVTDRNGLASSKALPLGRYTIKETKAPANYGATNDTYTAVLEHSGHMKSCNVVDCGLDGVGFLNTTLDGCFFGRIAASDIRNLHTATITQGGATNGETDRNRESILAALLPGQGERRDAPKKKRGGR